MVSLASGHEAVGWVELKVQSLGVLVLNMSSELQLWNQKPAL
jgi:hypothetical protein